MRKKYFECREKNNNTLKVINVSSYDQSAGKGYEKKLDGLHDDKERMKKISVVILNYLKGNKLKKISIADFGGGTGNLLKFLIDKIRIECPDIIINALIVDINKKQLLNIGQEIKTIVGDITNLENKIVSNSLDIVLSRNVYHYLSLDDQERATNEAYRVLKVGGIFLNAFVSTSQENQLEINNFWTNFATIVANKKIERFFISREDAVKMFKEAGFKAISFSQGFYNVALVAGDEGLVGKYPSLLNRIKDIENHLLSFSPSSKQEFKIKFSKTKRGEKTISISQSVEIVYGKK